MCEIEREGMRAGDACWRSVKGMLELFVECKSVRFVLDFHNFERSTSSFVELVELYICNL